MKNIWILIALVCLVASAAVVGFTGSGDEDGDAIGPAGRASPRPKPRIRKPARRPAKRLNLSGTSGGGGGGHESARSELQVLLQHYQRSYSGERARRIESSARARSRRLSVPLMKLLRTGEGKFLREAIALAGHMGDPALRPPVEELARSGPPATRASAILAAERLGPWPNLEIENFLRDPAEDVVLAALSVSAGREVDRPSETIIQLLDHDSASVRNAAMAALPEKLTEKQIGLLVRSVELGTGVLARNAMRVLGRAGYSERVESVLVDRLEDAEQETRSLALALLSEKPGKLRQPRKVWNLDWSRGADDGDHARALYCLEKTRSFDLEELTRAAALMPPLPRYFAARCLVSAGNREGFRLLLDIDAELEEKILLGIETAGDVPLRIAVHKLLGFVARTGPYATREIWQKWFDRDERFAPRDLAPHGLDLK